MKKVLLAIIAIMTVGLLAGMVLAVNGASTVNEVSSSTMNGSLYPPANHSAIAGNVTEITIVGTSGTQTWQGYYGNVSGTITLENGVGDVMYNWSSASPSGEVLASTSSSVTWASVACFDMGTDLAGSETTYNINSNDVDGIDETFSGISSANVTIAASELEGCNATYIYDAAGEASSTFEEVLLHDGADIVFASILAQDQTGFDNAAHDFEMLVLEDGHDGNAATTDYYFYVELN